MELAIVISYPTNVSGMIGILKMSPKHSKNYTACNGKCMI